MPPTEEAKTVTWEVFFNFTPEILQNYGFSQQTVLIPGKFRVAESI